MAFAAARPCSAFSLVRARKVTRGTAWVKRTPLPKPMVPFAPSTTTWLSLRDASRFCADCVEVDTSFLLLVGARLLPPREGSTRASQGVGALFTDLPAHPRNVTRQGADVNPE